MTRREGSVMINGTIAYAPQSPWYGVVHLCWDTLKLRFDRIMSATVRENILFSHEFDETFYNLVVEGKRSFSRLLHDLDFCSSLRTWPRSCITSQWRYDRSRRKGYVCSTVCGPPLITNFIGITVCHLFLCAMNMWLILTVKWRSTC